MKFKEDLQKLSVQIAERRKYVTNEEMTKQVLVIPFLQVLGYDVFNPLEVRPEYLADFGKRKSEKVDYAIFKDGEPIMFIEVKTINETLENYNTQLARYFNATPEVRVAVLTNGIEYKFFTDLDKNNIMDETPFYKVDITNLTDADVEILSKFKKEHFQTSEIVKCAEELIYTSNLNNKLRNIFKDPPDEFIRYLIKDFSDTRITSNVIERFRPIVKKSISMAILELVRQGLFPEDVGAKVGEKTEEISEKDTESREEPDDAQKLQTTKKPIVTTEEEIQGFEQVKSILNEAGKDTSEVNYKDTTAYFGIFYRNIFNWFLRLNLGGSRKFITTRLPVERVQGLATGFEVEQAPKTHGESRVFIESIEDLPKLKELIIACFDEVAGA